MNTVTLKALSLLTAVAIPAGAYAQRSPETSAAVMGSIFGAAAGGIGSRSGMSNRQAVVTGLATAALIATVTYTIAKRQATERQRQIAEARARRTYAGMSQKRKSTLKSKKVRYIAVDAPKDGRTSPKAQRNVMIWDTQTQQVVGNNVYDVQSAPKVGSTAKFETYTAEYVGSGR